MKKVYEKPLAKKGRSLQSVTAVSIPTSVGKICLPSNGIVIGNGNGASI